MKNQITFLILFIVLGWSNSQAQVTQEWVARYNGGDDVASTIAVDGSGNVYVTGGSDIGNNSDYATIKYNSSGDSLWVARYNGPGNGGDYASSLAIDAAGNVYVTGVSTGSGSVYNFATIKYNSSGVQQWVQRYNGQIIPFYDPSLAVDDSGNVYVAGYGIGIVTIKYNSSGVQQWIQSYNGPIRYKGQQQQPDGFYILYISITVSDSGNVYVSGTDVVSTSDADYVTIKYNSSGVLGWVQRYNGPETRWDDARSIAIDDSENVYVTGMTYSNATRFDYATIKYNSSGDSLWVRKYNGTLFTNDFASSVAVDGSGNVYVTGSSINNSSTDGDYATIKYNPSGVQQWVQSYNGPNSSEDRARSIAVGGSGDVYVTGGSYMNGNYEYATIKYNSLGIQQWIQRYNGVGANSLAIDVSENIYVTGSSNGDYTTIKYSQSVETLTLTVNLEACASIDTITVELRSATSPFNIIESRTALGGLSVPQNISFNNAVDSTRYYLVVKHRNSIETWSARPITFTGDPASYDFTTAQTQTFGNNSTLVGSEWSIYTGDVNQDGIVEGSDLSLIDNDAFNSVTGHVPTDLNCDEFVDATDLSFADNNSYNTVLLIRP